MTLAGVTGVVVSHVDGGWGAFGWGALPWGSPTGYLAPRTTKSISGTASTASITSIASSQNIVLQGHTATGLVGLLAVVILGDRYVSLHGIEVVGTAGRLVTDKAQPILGVSASEGIGSLTEHSGAAYAVIIRSNSQITQTVGIVSTI